MAKEHILYSCQNPTKLKRGTDSVLIFPSFQQLQSNIGGFGGSALLLKPHLILYKVGDTIKSDLANQH
jgi:hypothetical protein